MTQEKPCRLGHQRKTAKHHQLRKIWKRMLMDNPPPLLRDGPELFIVSYRLCRHGSGAPTQSDIVLRGVQIAQNGAGPLEGQANSCSVRALPLTLDTSTICVRNVPGQESLHELQKHFLPNACEPRTPPLPTRMPEEGQFRIILVQEDRDFSSRDESRDYHKSATLTC